MPYDPAWDMPKQNWAQQGSFELPVVPPDISPSGGTSVCIGPIADEWIPILLGAVDQLRNPSSFKAANDDALYTMLARVDELRGIIGMASPCCTFELRFSADCKLQQSTDSGVTWIDVSGWDANFSNCVSGIIIPPVPPNPGPNLPAIQACNLSGYIANEIIKLAITNAVSDYNSGHSQLQYAVNIFDLIAFAFPITSFAINAFYILYSEYTAGTISDFTDASTDPLLWVDVTCAIYNATKATGYITPANLGAVIANVCGITYTHPAVISAICSFITNVGLANLQAMQNIGVVDSIDCSGCATWSHYYDFTAAANGWSQYSGNPAAWTLGVGWHSAGTPPSCDIHTFIGPAQFFTEIDIAYHMSSANSATNPPYCRVDDHSSGSYTVHELPRGVGDHLVTVPINAIVDEFIVLIETDTGVGVNTITSICLRGHGADTLTAPPCP